jgi:hypothetical protein
MLSGQLSLMLAVAVLSMQPADGLGTGLQVLWADPALQQKKRVALEQNNAENRMVRSWLAVRCMCSKSRATEAASGHIYVRSMRARGMLSSHVQPSAPVIGKRLAPRQILCLSNPSWVGCSARTMRLMHPDLILDFEKGLPAVQYINQAQAVPALSHPAFSHAAVLCPGPAVSE